MNQQSVTASVVVTDHAVVQYLRRFKGVDIDSVKAEIASKITRPAEYAQFLGDTSAKIRTGDTILVVTAYLAKHSGCSRGGAKSRKTKHGNSARSHTRGE